MRRLSPLAVSLLLLAGVTVPGLAEARGTGSGSAPRGGFGKSIPAPGLTAVFPSGAACPPIASPYGSPTRYDGSSRKGGGAEGLHGGIDLTLEEDTPLLAVAAGRVLQSGEGGLMEGRFLWLLHLPEETGIGFAFLSKYQHLNAISPLRPGESVRVGQEVARSGRTGTVGGHYGSRGYPHLHLTVRVLEAGDAARAVAGDAGFDITKDSVIVDPLTIYVPGLMHPADAAALPADRKTVAVPYANREGTIRPAESRAIWPVACP